MLIRAGFTAIRIPVYQFDCLMLAPDFAIDSSIAAGNHRFSLLNEARLLREFSTRSNGDKRFGDKQTFNANKLACRKNARSMLVRVPETCENSRLIHRQRAIVLIRQRDTFDKRAADGWTNRAHETSHKNLQKCVIRGTRFAIMTAREFLRQVRDFPHAALVSTVCDGSREFV